MRDLPIKQYLLRGGIWALIGKLLTALMGLALFGLLARLFSPEDMGVYFLAFNLATFFSILARIGLENTLLRLISQALERNQSNLAHKIIKKGLHLGVLGAAIVAILVYFVFGPWAAQYLFKSDMLGQVIGLVAIWLVLLAFQYLFAEIFRAFHDVRMAVFTGGLFTSVATVIIVSSYMLIKGYADLNQVLPWMLLAGIMNIILALWMLTTKLHTLGSLKNGESIKYSAIVNHSWPLLINTLTLFVLSQSDFWILGSFHSDEEIAIYGAAARLVLLTGMALSIVNAVVPPLITRLNVQNDQMRLENILRTAATYAAIPSIMVLSIFIFFGSWVLKIVFGEFYISGAGVLLILSIGQVINVFVGSCGYTLIMMGHQRTVMLITITSAVIALVSGIVLVQVYGVLGLAFGYALAMAVQQLAMLLFARLLCGVWTHASLKYFSAFNILK